MKSESIRLIATWTAAQNPETDNPTKVEWYDPRLESSTTEYPTSPATLEDFAHIIGDTQSDPSVHEDGSVSFGYSVEPTYTYEVEADDEQPQIVVRATCGKIEASALFVVDAKGRTAADWADCDTNPFSDDGCWPEPPYKERMLASYRAKE